MAASKSKKQARPKAAKPAKRATGGKTTAGSRKPAHTTAPAKKPAPAARAKAAKAAVPAKAAPTAKAAAAAKPTAAPKAPGAGKVPPGKPAPKTAPAQAPHDAKPTPRTRGAGRGAAQPRLPAGVAPFPSLAGVVRYDEPLAKHTTFRIGGPATVHFQPQDAAATAAAVQWAKAQGLPWLVLGLGSNVLVRDGGFRGLVLKIGKGLDELSVRGRLWKAGAGLPTPLLARRTADAGFEGVQRLIGVPGTVGGGVYMNAGAHGQDFASVLQSATLLTPAGTVVEKPRSAIPFAYRRSGLEDHVVLGCTLQLAETPVERVRADLNFVLKKRREGTPFDQPCCGSVFKNPRDSTAAKLIEQCKLKGRRVGAAEISIMHANYIVNRGGATADDVLKLIDVARTAVFKEFGVELELEVKVLGVAAA